MVPYMGWVLLGYGLAAALVHVFHGLHLRKGPRENPVLHYILVTSNHGQQMEWYLRALSWYARLRGMPLKVTVLDAGSEDDTVAIAWRFHAQGEMELTVIGLPVVQSEDMEDRATDAVDGSPIFIDLRIPQEAGKIPYVHV